MWHGKLIAAIAVATRHAVPVIGPCYALLQMFVTVSRGWLYQGCSRICS